RATIDVVAPGFPSKEVSNHTRTARCGVVAPLRWLPEPHPDGAAIVVVGLPADELAEDRRSRLAPGRGPIDQVAGGRSVRYRGTGAEPFALDRQDHEPEVLLDEVQASEVLHHPGPG